MQAAPPARLGLGTYRSGAARGRNRGGGAGSREIYRGERRPNPPPGGSLPVPFESRGCRPRSGGGGRGGGSPRSPPRNRCLPRRTAGRPPPPPFLNGDRTTAEAPTCLCTLLTPPHSVEKPKNNQNQTNKNKNKKPHSEKTRSIQSQAAPRAQCSKDTAPRPKDYLQHRERGAACPSRHSSYLNQGTPSPRRYTRLGNTAQRVLSTRPAAPLSENGVDPRPSKT